MEKINIKRFAFVAITLSFFAAALIITAGLVAKTKKDDPQVWVLHSYGNSVALYNGDDIVEVFSGITLDTLPESDRRQLDYGLSFLTREEALNAIEDYDG